MLNYQDPFGDTFFGRVCTKIATGDKDYKIFSKNEIPQAQKRVITNTPNNLALASAQKFRIKPEGEEKPLPQESIDRINQDTSYRYYQNLLNGKIKRPSLFNPTYEKDDPFSKRYQLYSQLSEKKDPVSQKMNSEIISEIRDILVKEKEVATSSGNKLKEKLLLWSLPCGSLPKAWGSNSEGELKAVEEHLDKLNKNLNNEVNTPTLFFR